MTNKIEINLLKWVEQWYGSQCDEEWEHEYGLKIYTTDNPGWSVQINLCSTEWESLEIPYQLFEKSEDDWYGISISKSIFKASGDPTKLEFLLEKFKEIIEAQ